MTARVLGISGSPIKNSNTDRAVQAIMEASGLPGEFVKLSTLNVRPCLHCKKCVWDNTCKINDDFPALAEKIKAAEALVLGYYSPYGQIDAFTKALLERFWSFRHLKNLLGGKLCATVLTCIDPTSEAAAYVNRATGAELKDYERMELLGQVTIQGNIPCVTCGPGDDCEISGLKKFRGPEAKTADFPYMIGEEQTEAWAWAQSLGRTIGTRLRAQ